MLSAAVEVAVALALPAVQMADAEIYVAQAAARVPHARGRVGGCAPPAEVHKVARERKSTKGACDVQPVVQRAACVSDELGLVWVEPHERALLHLGAVRPCAALARAAEFAVAIGDDGRSMLRCVAHR